MRDETTPGTELDQLREDLAEALRHREVAIRQTVHADQSIEPIDLEGVLNDALFGLYEWDGENGPDSAPDLLINRIVATVRPIVAHAVKRAEQAETELAVWREDHQHAQARLAQRLDQRLDATVTVLGLARIATEAIDEAEAERDQQRREAAEYRRANTSLQEINTIRTTERDQLRASARQHEDLLASIVLYIKWHYVTRSLTTEQKDLFADALERDAIRAHGPDGDEPDPDMARLPSYAPRWWRSSEEDQSKESNHA